MCLCEGVCGCQRHWVTPQVESPNIGARNKSQDFIRTCSPSHLSSPSILLFCFVFKYKRVEGLITEGRSQSSFGFQLVCLTR